jgi:nitric oxide reductase NorQ protein
MNNTMTKPPTKPQTELDIFETVTVQELSDEKKYTSRYLRNIAIEHELGELKWRNTALRADLLQAISEAFPDGKVPMSAVKSQPEPATEQPKAKVTRTKSASAVPGLDIPKSDPTFVIERNLRLFLSALRRMAEDSENVMNTLLVGPQGCGKTSVAYEFAAKAGLPLLKMNCPLVREPRDWFGAKRVENGSIVWDKALFAEAVKHGNVVIVLDELTRATPNVLNSLLPLLDHTRTSYIEEAKENLVVGPNTFFFATANIGQQFSGTYKLDAALQDRFGAIVECSFLGTEDETQLLVKRTGIEEEIANRLVRIANLVRNENQSTTGRLTETISTRVLLDLATLYTKVKEPAFKFTILPKFSAENGKQSERAQVMGFIQGQFPNFSL